MWTRSLTRPVSRTVCLSTEASASAPGLIRVDANTSPFGLEDATPGYRACVRVLALLGRVWRASLPGAFWCSSPFLVLLVLLLFSAPSGMGLPFSCPFECLLAFLCFFFALFAPPLSRAFSGYRPWLSWALALCGFLPPPPIFFLFFFLLLPLVFSSGLGPIGLLFVFPRPPCPLVFFLFLPPPPPRCLFCGSPRPVAWLSLCSRYFCVFCLAFCCSLAGAPSPPLGVCLAGVVALPLGIPCFSSAVLLLPACLAFVSGCRRLLPPPPPWCALAVKAYPSGGVVTLHSSDYRTSKAGVWCPYTNPPSPPNIATQRSLGQEKAPPHNRRGFGGPRCQ